MAMQVPRINAAQRRINNQNPGTFTLGMPKQRVNAAQRRINNQAAGAPQTPATGGGAKIGATALRQERLRAQNPTRFNGGQPANTQPENPVQVDPSKQIAHLQGNIDKFGAANRPNDVKRLQALQGQQPQGQLPDDNGTINGVPKDAFSRLPGGPAGETGDIGIPGGEMNGANNSSTSNANAFFPSMQSFEPQNYEGSPMFKFQQKEGEDSIKRSLAKRGLLNSGAELEGLAKFNTALVANESDKARGYAQNEADRYERMAQNEATRRERGDERASNDAYRWTQMLLNQNPMDYAVKGTGEYADTVGKEANTMANYLQQMYTRATGSGGGGGGGMNTPAPFPSGPDFSGINTIGALTGGSGNNNWWNGILSSLPGFFDKKTYQ